MSDDLVSRMDRLWSVLEEEGFYTKANTVTLAKTRIEELETKLAECKKYRDAYAECDRIGTQAVRDLEAKLAKAVEELEDMQKVPRSDASYGILMVMIKYTLAELKGQKDE